MTITMVIRRKVIKIINFIKDINKENNKGKY